MMQKIPSLREMNLQKVGLPLEAVPLGACEKGHPLDIGILNKWKKFPDDYMVKKGDKIRIEIEFSRRLPDEAIRDFCEGPMKPGRNLYVKMTNNELIMEYIAFEDAENSVGVVERGLEELIPLFKNVEAFGVGKNWLLMGGASIGLLGLGYVAVR